MPDALDRSGCAGGPVSLHCTLPQASLPDAHHLPASEQKALAAELGREQGNPETMRWIEDYIGLRDQVRVCQKGV